MYKQWSRIEIIGDTLRRAYTIKGTENDNQKLVLQYIVPKQQRPDILELAHDIALSGHLGVEKTVERIRERFYWPNWEQQTREYVLSCTTCQEAKYLNQNSKAPLKPILTTRPMQVITMDIAGPLPRSSKQNTYVLVICDHFSKWIQVYPLRRMQAKDVAKRLVSFISQHALPEHILTDVGTNFQANMMHELYDILDIHGLRTSAYHPQGDGLSERFIRTIKQMIKSYTKKARNQKDWDEKLELLQLAYNTSCHSTTKYSPYYLMFGRRPKLPLDLIIPDLEIPTPEKIDEYVERMITNLKQVFHTVIRNRNRRMNKAKIRHDRKLKAKIFKIGDHVWLTNEKTESGQNSSLKRPYMGPYIVTEVLNVSNYKIRKLREGSKEKIVNRQRMKKCIMRPDYLKTNEELKQPQVFEAASSTDTQDEFIVPSSFDSDSITSRNTDTMQPNIQTQTIPEVNQAENQNLEAQNQPVLNQKENQVINPHQSLRLETTTPLLVDVTSHSHNSASSVDSINNNYYEPRQVRPKRDIRRPDCYNPSAYDKKKNHTAHNIHIQLPQTSALNTKTYTRTTNNIQNTPKNHLQPESDDNTESHTNNRLIKKQRHRYKRKKKPPDK